MPPAVVLLHHPAAVSEPLQLFFQRCEIHPEGAAVLVALDAFHRAHPEHEIFISPFLWGDHLRAVHNDTAVEHTGNISFQIPHIAIPAAAEVGVGRGAYPHILLPQPILPIVPRAIALLGKVGHLILFIAQLRQPVHRPQVLVRLVIAADQVQLVLPLPQGRPLLQGQGVHGDVLRLQRQNGLHRLLPRLHGLVRQAEDQVQIQIFEPSLPDQLHCLLRLLKGVQPVEQGQLLVMGGLDAHGDAVDAPVAQGAQQRGGHAVRIHLHGDLAVSGQVIFLMDGFEQLLQGALRQNAGRAAAQIDGIQHISLRPRRQLLQVQQQCPDVIPHPILAVGQRIKITVIAFSPTEGYVDIQTQPASPQAAHPSPL